ncbi:undecaprenyldiphospho-muramoylpentapeptide beta-N-acetylglucosaminyltransferase [Methylacidiphilum kamchatkense]|uniref:UDP-N-acetylglucosamine--N-acetylmuramyl-(pentapeptide) pyrophosphoryl-undecaprenol N-acetylglucosamine transferase n=1 Tax=Methylacidiphilum kamchatkense Kam1 TaxID=1202785 RepID=A0A516TN35_9BACT|nr:undecaprenyldiphospho-muramoylpentapeptide beta-N-acetylglucosaminyltransferase [Methylacidiphilum kamchatkense]QDQ42647.1 UDP-N-acetylglucosamine-N-acetylmuramylpentapeptide N-acetylglucosamine transferase [Methylacidiphilum kamchatkense Kam1]
MKPFHILIPCGGTGGHLFPGIAVAEKLIEKGHHPLLILSDKPVDREAIKNKKNIAWDSLPVAGWPGLFSSKIISFSIKLFDGYKKCRSIFLSFKPDLILAFGGFISALPLFMGANRKLPMLIHEANAVPGLVTRLFSNRADFLLLGMEECEVSLSPDKKIFTGIPIRKELSRLPRNEACQRTGLEPSRKTLFVFGGSQGASGINRLMLQLLPLWIEQKETIQFIHLTGPNDYEDCLKAYSSYGYRVVVEPFSHRMNLYYSLADLVISRAGAMTLTEICAFGLPSILIPYPYAAHDHQTKNARVLAKEKAAFVFEESKTTPQSLKESIDLILNNGQLAKEMGAAAHALFKADATDKIVEIIERCLLKKEN